VLEKGAQLLLARETLGEGELEALKKELPGPEREQPVPDAMPRAAAAMRNTTDALYGARG
jgi:hypothetical protein